MELYELLPDFRNDSIRWTEFMNDSLQHLEHFPGCRVAMDNVLYAIDVLRNSAGLFGLGHVIELADGMESAMTQMSSQRELFDNASIPLLLSCCAHLRMLIEQTDPDWVRAERFEIESMEQALLGQLGECGHALHV